MPPATEALAETHRTATVNGIRMHYVEAGAGDLVVLLHGFPECWYSWRHQIAALAPRYRIVAPDLRGYHETEARGPYDTDTLQQDVLELIEALGEERAHIVGHDWGGAIAWLLAIEHPEAVRSLAVCNIPHPALFQRGLRSWTQLRRSWYMAFFQLPWVPERLLAAGNYRRMARALFAGAPEGTYTRDDVRFYVESWRKHGLTGPINWYRALLRHPRRAPESRSHDQCAGQTLIWGENDPALGKELTRGTDRYVEDLRVHYLPQAGHFVQQDAPDEVSALLLTHLREVGVHAAA